MVRLCDRAKRRSRSVFARAPLLNVRQTTMLLALAWAVTAAAVGFMGGEPAFSADLTLTLIALLLLGGGEYDAASWIYLSSAIPWLLRT